MSTVVRSTPPVSPLGSYSAEHLPENPITLPLINEAHENLIAAQALRITDPSNAEKTFRIAHDLFSKVLSKLPWELNTSFPKGWSKVYQWHAYCALGCNLHAIKPNLKELEAGEQSWDRFLEFTNRNRDLTQEDTQQIHEDTRDFFRRLGLLFISQQKYHLALKEFSKGITLVGGSCSLFFEKSQIYLKLERYPEVIANLESIEKIYESRDSQNYEPTPYIPYRLGIFYKQIGNFEKAEKYLKEAITLYETLAQEEPKEKASSEQGIQSCNEQLKKIASLKESVILWKSQIADDSHNCFQKVYQLASKNSEDMSHLAIAFQQLKRWEDAFICAKKAEELAKTTPQAEPEALFLLSSAIGRGLSIDEEGRNDLCDALEWCRENSPHSESNFYYMLGTYYKHAAKLTSAEKYTNLALASYRKVQNSSGVQACSVQLVKIRKLKSDIDKVFQVAIAAQEKERKKDNDSSKEESPVHVHVGPSNGEKEDLTPPAAIQEAREKMHLLSSLLQNSEKEPNPPKSSAKYQEVCAIAAAKRKKIIGSISESVSVLVLSMPIWVQEYTSKLPYQEAYLLSMGFKRHKSFGNAEIIARHATTLATDPSQRKECACLIHAIEKDRMKEKAGKIYLSKNLSTTYSRTLRPATTPPLSSSSLSSSSATAAISPSVASTAVVSPAAS